MENKDYQKRVAAIHDLSGFGKCSLTVALPILSAAGIEACAMPPYYRLIQEESADTLTAT
jgi:pyridoxine kinase